MSKNKFPKKPFPWRCSTCREKAVFDGVTDYELDLEYEGCTYHIEIPNLKTPRCRKCGAVCIDNEADVQITMAFLRQAKLLTPKRIRNYRERVGLTQNELAEALGIPELTVSRWEDGMQIPTRSLDNMLRLFFGSPEARELLTKRKLSKIGLVLREKSLAST